MWGTKLSACNWLRIQWTKASHVLQFVTFARFGEGWKNALHEALVDGAFITHSAVIYPYEDHTAAAPQAEGAKPVHRTAAPPYFAAASG